ncbi:NUDIX hydrolase [Tomitella biformata]|uniref:NUDIX hydrolase n=1 Tax=Tomitella biformata TaxID=630403 RepID=UPI0004AED697|nr:NUDIX hydrolase [Tomitella biformata]
MKLSVDESAPPAKLRDAATVMLLRDGEPGLEVFLLRRVLGMAFAGGMTVFPGGGVDEGDSDAHLSWSGAEPSWWASRFDTDEARAKRLVCAAARETFEECGILLAGAAPGAVVTNAQRYHDARQELEKHELDFSGFLRREGLVLGADRLRPWSHWITPIGESRRYDTHFFVAALPEGQTADGLTSEASEVLWSTPSAALEHWRAGQSGLLPPTWSQLESLQQYATVAEVMAAEPVITPIQPDLVREGERWRVEFDGGDRYLAQMPS